MRVELRPISEEELPAFARASSIGFGESDEWFEREREFVSSALDRTCAGFEGDGMVSTSRNFPFEFTVPGGATLAAGGVSAVTVMPTHRRQGLLRQMMTWLLEDSVQRDEPLSMLTASEATIYSRFGYGVSHRALGVRFDKRDIEFLGPRPAGRIRLIDVQEAEKVAPDVFERFRLSCPGAVSRPPEWWCHYYDPSMGNRFDAVYESESGAIDGYITYSIKDKWGMNGAEHRLNVHELVGMSDDAVHSLWRFVSEIDLIATIGARGIPMDTPLPRCSRRFGPCGSSRSTTRCGRVSSTCPHVSARAPTRHQVAWSSRSTMGCARMAPRMEPSQSRADVTAPPWRALISHRICRAASKCSPRRGSVVCGGRSSHRQVGCSSTATARSRRPTRCSPVRHCPRPTPGSKERN